MITKIYFILIVLFPASAFAQSIAQYDSTALSIIHEDCEDKIFSKVEILPSLKKGITNFEDTLTYYLKSANAFKNGTHITYKFLVTTSAHIFYIEKEDGDFQYDPVIKKFLVSHSFMWKTAIQNGRKVCAFVRLEIEISNDQLQATVKQ